jgi:hypothetical protein
MRDNTFKYTVDLMCKMLLDGQLAAGEMREAALMAELKYRQLTPVNQLFPEIEMDVPPYQRNKPHD